MRSHSASSYASASSSYETYADFEVYPISTSTKPSAVAFWERESEHPHVVFKLQSVEAMIGTDNTVIIDNYMLKLYEVIMSYLTEATDPSQTITLTFIDHATAEYIQALYMQQAAGDSSTPVSRRISSISLTPLCRSTAKASITPAIRRLFGSASDPRKLHQIDFMVICGNRDCKNVGLSRKKHKCSKCRLQWYCHQRCQAADWHIHKFTCRNLVIVDRLLYTTKHY